MVDESTAMDWPPVMECLVKGIEDETRMSGAARPPVDDASGERVDHESDVNEVCQVATYVKSESQNMFGAGTLDWRFTRSSGLRAALSDTVVLTGLQRIMP